MIFFIVDSCIEFQQMLCLTDKIITFPQQQVNQPRNYNTKKTGIFHSFLWNMDGDNYKFKVYNHLYIYCTTGSYSDAMPKYVSGEELSVLEWWLFEKQKFVFYW